MFKQVKATNYQLFEEMELHGRMKGYRLYSLEQNFSQ